MTSGISRRTLLINGALVGGATFFGPWRHHHVYAAKTDKPILIGLTHDASGQFANSGQDEQRGTIMAIEEANAKGGVLGRKLAYITADTETTPATGSRVAERMITRNEVAFLVGAIQSGVANAIGQVAQKYGCVYFNTNSSSPTESGKDCKRVKFVWDGSGANFALAAADNAVRTFGKKWMLLTNDYVWGHNTSKATREIGTRFGAQIVDEILVPVGTRDFSPILLKVQQAKPDVVVLALGANDGLRGIDTETMAKNLSDAIDVAQSAHVAVLLAGMKLPPNYGSDYTERFESVFPRLAKEKGVPLIPFLLDGVATQPALNLGDGIHPNADGYSVIADTVIRYLVPLLETLREREAS